MDEIKTACIDSRKQAIMASIDSGNEDIVGKIEEYFERLEEFAKDCKDINDFETKFATSDLAKEYADMFGYVMANTEQAKEERVEDMRHDAVDSMNHFARRRAKQEAYDVARDIPGVGEVLTAKQHFDFFSRFKKKKDD